MQLNKPRRLLLIGGGHAHLFVLEALRRRQAEWRGKLEVTLLARELLTPYSGMLPGLIAGHYRSSQCEIDLRALADSAGVVLQQASVQRLDLARNVALTADAEWAFDMVSIDIGSAPPLSEVPGALEHGLGVKPVDAFLQRWQALQQRVASLTRPLHLVVVGGGAGGVELVLAMAHRLTHYQDRVKWSLVTRGKLLDGYPERAARLAARQLARAGVALRTGSSVSAVTSEKVLFADGSSASFDGLVWATGAAAQPWLAVSGLATLDGGFVEINDHLQSTSHPQVFAAGDIASSIHHPRPKAGVFALRQGPPLADNLFNYAFGLPLRRYRPQRGMLSLLSTGGRHAIACWQGLVWEGDWVWRWKDRIDSRFMQRFSAPFPPADVEVR